MVKIVAWTLLASFTISTIVLVFLLYRYYVVGGRVRRAAEHESTDGAERVDPEDPQQAA